jgi:hypothetical protein
VTEVLNLLAMWALLQVLFLWCFARGDGLRALELEEYGYRRGDQASRHPSAARVHRQPLHQEQP